jgi:hypothetical protein
MPDTVTQPETPPSTAALRIVLFGMPDAGKSSLLGALAQAAQTQEHVLSARLTDRSQGLLELQRRLYEDRPRETLQEVVPYPVTLQPLSAGRPSGAARETIFIDCDGRVANELLSRRRSLGPTQPDGALASAIVEADTLVLVIDASTGPQGVERDFSQFDSFLRLLEQNRGQRSDVGGLPVYLVLTKCDKLAKSTDTNITWMERIEEHKRQVDRKFKEFLAGPREQDPLPFGKIELHLWATAVKRPQLADAPARPREPYGVAELFRQCVDSAAAFHQRRARAGRRLRMTLGGVLGVVGGMLLLALYFLVTRPGSATTALENQVRTFRSANDLPAELFREPVEDRLKHLQRIKNDADFAHLSGDLQDYVNRKLAEVEAYQRYNKEFLDRVTDPRFARSLDELARIEEGIKALPLPPSYETEWSQTPAGQRRRHWSEEVELVRREVKTATARLGDLIRRSQRLGDESISVGAYRKLRDELLREDDRLPYREGERNHLLPGSNRLTYENVMQFDQVDALWREWKEARQKMQAAAQ